MNCNSTWSLPQVPRSEELLKEVESLPIDERIRIVESLLRSLNPPDPEIDRLWIVEAQRRLDEIRAGIVQPIPGDQVMQRLRERFPEA